MTPEELDIIIDNLHNRYGYKKSAIKKWYILLQNKSCFIEEDASECLEIICDYKEYISSELSRRRNNNQKVEYHVYPYTTAFLINYAIYKTYGVDSLAFVDENFLDEIGESEYDRKRDILMENIYNLNAKQLLLKLEYDGDIEDDDYE